MENDSFLTHSVVNIRIDFQFMKPARYTMHQAYIQCFRSWAMKAFETKDQSSYIFSYLVGSVCTQFMGNFWFLRNKPTSF